MIEDPLTLREQRTTVSKLGLDLIITPEREVKVVEINGANSGSSGLKKLTGRDVDLEIIEYLTHTELPLFHHGRMENLTFPPYVTELLSHQLLEGKDFRPRAAQGLERFALAAFPGKREDIEGIIWNTTFNRYLFNEQKYLLINPFAVEETTYDKARTHALFQGTLAHLRPQMTFVVRANRECDVSHFKPTTPYIILKPTDESIGRNVIAIPAEEIFASDSSLKEHPLATYRRQEKKAYQEPNVIMEELIPSIKITSQQTGEEHNACMRYLVLVESDGGEITVRHYGGYWRLAPNSVQSTDLQKKFVANYSSGAIPEHVSEEDLSLVRAVVDQFIPVLYRRMLRLPINERPDGLPAAAYCY